MNIKSVVQVLAIFLLMGSITACQKEEGPAEKAGKQIDHAVEKAGAKIEEAGDKLKEATEK